MLSKLTIAAVAVATLSACGAVASAGQVSTTPTIKPVVQEPSKPAAPSMTPGQSNATKTAKNYLSIMAFSKKGLIRQLSSSAGDGYSLADATYAAAHSGADWNVEAVKAATNYLSIMSFSHAGLVQQLSSSAGDGYTVAQAEYGVAGAGL